MSNWHSRSVFHVVDGERALRFYTETLGFGLDWNYAPKETAFVFQVALMGFQLIINEIEDSTRNRAGLGRVFVGLEDDQLEDFQQHVESHEIRFEVVSWGEPTLLIRDPDGNWITFWLPEKERAALKIGRTWP
jgi:catechol 2,3-dioxygenase-like lactoylglutathione lyase family enzyme